MKPILQEIPAKARVIYGVPEGQDARILAGKARALMPEDQVLIHIAQDDSRLAALRELLAFFAPDVESVEFPAWDCLPYDRVSPNTEIGSRRVAALTKLLAWQNEKRRAPRILLTTVNAALQRVMPRSALQGASLSVQKGGRLDVAHLQSYLIANGYTRTETVREAGEYAIRGGIIDLFPSGHDNPLRIDLFGDEVESIKAFDAMSQRSEGAVQDFSLQPVTEFFLNEESISRFRRRYLEEFGVARAGDPLYEAISEGRRYNGMEHWLPLFYDQLETVFDYALNAGVSVDHHGLEAYVERLSQTRDFYDTRKTMQEAAKKRKAGDPAIQAAIYNPVPVATLYMEQDEWNGLTDAADVLSPFQSPVEGAGAKKARDFADIRALPDGDVFGEVRKYLALLPQKKLIATYSEGSAARLRTLLENAGVKPVDVKGADDLKKLKSDQTGLAILGLEHGFVADDLAVITEADILGERLSRHKPSKKKRPENFLREVSSLNEGDLVVHIDHGIGKFVALETLKAAGLLHDCLKIEYAGGDKLFIPVENLEVLSRFGSDEGTVQLDKLGGAGWQARKARVKKNLMAIADHLLGIAAARKLKTAPKLDIGSDVYDQFAARFPYAETEDQERAITDTLAGLAGDYPMDRLVCGDVGFGKTEVAIRAAYVAAMSGAQVALIVPTTLLARQHTQNFTARFAGTSIRIGQLSRMVTPTEANKTREALAEGSVNIVIGTHALLAKSVKFDNLGLVIVDEEQKFGVKQKEKLKELQANVHVLTLSATPIPRTLQMSLTGVKEMSLITTPPVDRLAIRTFVMPYDPMIVREAILREHYRGGQTFYVCPRIADMEDLERELKELVPEVKVVTAHGQMDADDLDERMTAFYDGAFDILLATNIIESGIDIPTANTMIIHRSDMFGLAQLYQIRGRIGRSKVRAYAYLTYAPGLRLTDQAQKRLEVMETLDTLGSGFQLASHDMDIRGAGNLLGEQQSGHIKEVGVELYQQMLEEAVAAARHGGHNLDCVPVAEAWSPNINIGASVLIPENYVEDLGLRMSLYRRLQDLQTPEDVEGFAAEMIDRFGALPEEVENLLDIVTIKQLCKRACVSSVEAGPKGAVIKFFDNKPPNVEGLMKWLSTKAGSVKIRPDQSMMAIRAWDKPRHRINGVKTLMRELAQLA